MYAGVWRTPAAFSEHSLQVPAYVVPSAVRRPDEIIHRTFVDMKILPALRTPVHGRAGRILATIIVPVGYSEEHGELGGILKASGHTLLQCPTIFVLSKCKSIRRARAKFHQIHTLQGEDHLGVPFQRVIQAKVEIGNVLVRVTVAVEPPKHTSPYSGPTELFRMNRLHDPIILGCCIRLANEAIYTSMAFGNMRRAGPHTPVEPGGELNVAGFVSIPARVRMIHTLLANGILFRPQSKQRGRSCHTVKVSGYG